MINRFYYHSDQETYVFKIHFKFNFELYNCDLTKVSISETLSRELEMF